MIHEYKRVTVKCLSYNGKWKDLKLLSASWLQWCKSGHAMDKAGKKITKKSKLICFRVMGYQWFL